VRRRTQHRLVALGVGCCAAAATLVTAAGEAPASPQRGAANAAVSLRDAHHVKVIKVKRVGARQLQATIRPKALARPLGVRIILPVHYRPDRRYPTLYLFPGTSGHSTDWVKAGGAVPTTRPYDLITVTSDIGFDGNGGSWFSNWVDRSTAMGKAQFETYNAHQLIPWIDANLATIRNRTGRAVAGLSQGGYGAAILAARYPDKFVEMASFSGAPEIDRALTARAGANAVISATMVGLNHVQPDAPFGNVVTDQMNWKGHDPAYIVRNLRGMGLWLATADGAPGKYDDPVTNPVGTASQGGIESLTHFSTQDFVQRLRHLHMPVQVYDYNSGTHAWPYWARDLRHFIKPLMHQFANPPAPPTRVHYVSTEKHWKSFGWKVRWQRSEPIAWGSIHHANRHGFRVKGTGVAIIRSAPIFKRGTMYSIAPAGSKSYVTPPDRHGRLYFQLNTGDQTPKSTRVRITAMPKQHHRPID